MSTDTVIKVENLSLRGVGSLFYEPEAKQYRIGAKEGYKTFREILIDSAKAPFLRVQEAWSMAHRACRNGVEIPSAKGSGGAESWK